MYSTNLEECKASSINALIIAYSETEINGMRDIAELLCALIVPKTGAVQTFCAAKLSKNTQEVPSLHHKLTAIRCHPPLKMTDSTGRPFHFVPPLISIVIQIKPENKVNCPTDKPNLTWNPQKTEYKLNGVCNTLGFATPQMAGTHSEEPNQISSASLTQILSQEKIEEKQNLTSLETTPCKIIFREVYKNDDKAQISVRKIVGVERNHPNFHKFTVHYTDFSQGRKTPLETKTMVADTEPRLQQLFQDLLATCRKKGWKKI